MKNTPGLEEKFDASMGHHMHDFVLVQGKDLGKLFLIVNIQKMSMTLFDDLNEAQYFCERLLKAGVPIYDEIDQIPNWGNHLKEMPTSLHPKLLDFIKKHRKR